MTDSFQFLRSNFLATLAAALMLLFFSYFASIRILVFFYSQQRPLPFRYRYFRGFNKATISNCPSVTEQSFYKAANKLTLFFNALFFALVVFLFLCSLYI
jgi:hypothetical protein